MFRWTQRPERRDVGWTLLELLIAFAIIGVIAAIAVPIFLSQDARAEQAVLESNLASAYSLLYTAGYEGDAVLPSTLPAGETVEIGDAGSFTANYTLTVFGNSNSTICVQGQTPSGLQMMGDAGGVREGVCTPPFAYLDTAFTAGSDFETLAPTLDNRLGDPVFTATGDLPEGVQFDSSTGTFTGPAEAEWLFQAVQVAAGGNHTCVLTTVGTVKCWGDNRDGQLGNGTTDGGTAVVEVVGLPEPVTQIAAGYDHTCAITQSGGAYCWGSNADGQLGNVSTTNSNTAVQVSGFPSGVAQIAAGGDTTCLITDSGALSCFGDGAHGQLGNGANSDSSTPVTPSGLASGVQAVSIGDTHTCVVVAGGAVSCFGAGNSGQLGQGSSIGSNIPVAVQGVSTASSVAVGNNHSCAIISGGSVYCWGLNSNGQLGNGTTTGQSNSAIAVPGALGAAAISASGNHTCVQTGGGAVECWGGNSQGQLGSLNAGGNRNSPAVVTGTSNVVSVSTGNNHTCTVLADKSVQCWGSGAQGKLGYDPSGKPDFVSIPSEPYCTGDAVLNPSTNECVTTTQNPGFYTCPSGGTLNGSSCDTPVYVPASTTYSCPSGGSLSGTTCNYTYTFYTCPSGGSVSGSTCNYTYTFYTCPSGGSLSGTTCSYSYTYYTCPSGGSLSGSTCTTSYTYYTCPLGGTLNSSNNTCSRQVIDSYRCDTSGYPAGDIIEGPDGNNRCTWYAWVCSSPWTKVTGSLCKQRLGPWTSSSTCSSLSTSLGYQAGYPTYDGGTWTAAVTNTTYSCPSGWTRSGTTCSRTTTNTTSGNLGTTLCSTGRSSLCPSGTWSCSNTAPRPWSCTTTTTSTQAATATTTTTPGYCTYYTASYAYNAVKTFRSGFDATPVYRTDTYNATANPGTSTYSATANTGYGSYNATANTGYGSYNATANTGSGTYNATATTTPGYWTTSSYSATWNPPFTTETRIPAPWTEAKEYVASPTRVLGSGEQPGFPAELTILATYPNGTTHQEVITLTIDYPVPGATP